MDVIYAHTSANMFLNCHRWEKTVYVHVQLREYHSVKTLVPDFLSTPCIWL